MDVFFPFIYQKKVQQEEAVPVFLYIEEESLPQNKPEEGEDKKIVVIEF